MEMTKQIRIYEQISLLFKARTRMLDVKNNFRNKYKDNNCRRCGQTLETQKHVWKNALTSIKTPVKRYVNPKSFQMT